MAGYRGEKGGTALKRLLALALALGVLAFCVTTLVSSATAADDEDVVIVPKDFGDNESEAPPSGVIDFRDVDPGNAITECPQAGEPIDKQPKPLDLRVKDKVEQLSS